MRIFIGFSEQQREVAEDLATALRGQGHDVMVDEDDYPAGPTPGERQRAGVQAAARFIFLVSPESIAKGSNALAALSIARRKWPNPKHGVMAVIATPVPELPEYLRSANVFDPPGALVPEVVNAIYYSRRVHARRLGGIAASVVLAAAAIVGAVYLGFSSQRSTVPIVGEQAQFEFRASPDFLTWGGEGRYELINARPSAALAYRCEVSWERGRNIESLENDEACKEIRVKVVSRPFIDRNGNPYGEGVYDYEAEGVELTVFGTDGEAIWRSLVPVGLMNTSAALTLSGSAVAATDALTGMGTVTLTAGVPAEVMVGVGGAALTPEFTCKLRNDFGGQSIRVEGPAGSCRMNIVVSGGRLPPMLAVDVSHPSGWTGQKMLLIEAAGGSSRRQRASTRVDDEQYDPFASTLAAMTRFCGRQLSCEMELGALGPIREVRIGADPGQLEYVVPGSLFASAQQGRMWRIFFPAEPVAYISLVLEDGRVVAPQRVEITNPSATSAVRLQRNRGAAGVLAYRLDGNQVYLLTPAPIVRAWYDSGDRTFVAAAVSEGRNLVGLPAPSPDVLRLRLELSNGETLDDLEFAVNPDSG